MNKSDTGNILIDERVDLGKTKSYALTSLQRQKVQILSGVETSTLDYDNDQLIDRLNITFKADFLISGYFTWSGSLQTDNGTILGVSSGYSYLNPGQQTLSFNFNGTNIGESGIDGPYILKNVAIYGSGNAAISDNVWQTKAYQYSEFEGSEASFDNLRSKIQALVITGRGGKPIADGIRVSLLAKVNHAEEKYLASDATGALNVLNALSYQINAQKNKYITSADAEEVINLIEKIIKSL